jgi:hypothetical protein
MLEAVNMADEKWSSSIGEARPEFAVDGTDNLLFSQQLIRLMVVEEDYNVRQCEAIVNNWGAVGNSIGYLFSDSGAFDVGKPFEVKAQNSTFFHGRISWLKGEYSEEAPPVLIVGAKTPKTRSTVHPAGSVWALDMGASLREIAVAVGPDTTASKGRSDPGRVTLAGHGVARLNTMLHINDHIIIQELGSRFSGDYSVTSVKHLWDQTKGSRTEFAIERPM